MIVRKPYAFLIKHFKFIHLIMTIIICYLIYRTSILLNFFNEYVGGYTNVVGQDLTGNLFNFLMFFLPFLLMIISIIILSVMVLKKKPMVQYIINIITSFLIFIIYNSAFATLQTMEFKLVDIRVARLSRDFLILILIFQISMLILNFIRTTGFDIKKFNFGQDLEELEIQAEDNEEVEVEFNLDTNRVRRKLNKKIRFSKYVYIENKFLIDIFVLLTVSIISFLTYYNFGILNKTYKQSTAFSTTEFIMQIENAFVTNKDYKGNIIDKNSKFIVLQLKIRKNSSLKKYLKTVRAELIVNDKKYYHSYTYNEKFLDLGITYNNQEINKEFDKYILIYEIPKSINIKKVKFNYVDSLTGNKGLNPKYIKVNLDTYNLDATTHKKSYVLGDEINFKNSIFKESSLIINTFDIQNKYIEQYNFCAKVNECYESIEYVKPNIANTYNKTLIKINGTFNLDQKVVINKYLNLYNFIDFSSKIVYKIEGIVKTHDLNLVQIKPIKAVKENTYYIEVLEEVKNATDIAIVFNVRDYNYTYYLKGGSV